MTEMSLTWFGLVAKSARPFLDLVVLASMLLAALEVAVFLGCVLGSLDQDTRG